MYGFENGSRRAAAVEQGQQVPQWLECINTRFQVCDSKIFDRVQPFVPSQTVMLCR